MEAEGLIYSDCYDLTNKTNFRSTLWGTDESEAPAYGFITFDWQASSTADSLNKDIVVVLPPVAKVNGVWQYYIDNGRAIKPDGWSISVAAAPPMLSCTAPALCWTTSSPKKAPPCRTTACPCS